jgi:hypothetical protein
VINVVSEPIRVPKFPIPFIFTDTASNLLKFVRPKNQHNYSPLNFDVFTNMRFDFGFFSPQHYRITKAKNFKGIDEIIKGLDYLANTRQYFMDVFETVFALENEKVKGTHRKYNQVNRVYEDINYDGSFKDIFGNYIVEQFYNSLLGFAHAFGYQLHHKSVNMAELQKKVELLVTNPLIINSTYNLYDDPTLTDKNYKKWDASGIWHNWIDNNVEEIWSRRTVKTLDSYDAAELQELFNDKYEEWMQINWQQLRGHLKNSWSKDKHKFPQPPKPPYVLVSSTPDNYSHMDLNYDYHTFTLVLSEVELKDISEVYSKVKGEPVNLEFHKNLMNQSYEYFIRDSQRNAKLFYCMRWSYGGDDMDWEIGIFAVPKPVLFDMVPYAQGAADYMRDEGILPDWESVAQRHKIRIIPLYHMVPFVNWISTNPFEFK